MLRESKSHWASGLEDRLRERSLLVFAGLAKNVGKTTALNGVNAWFAQESVGITSIGYDGEAKDALYGHPKPPVRIYPGQLLLTAENFLVSSALSQAPIPYQVLERWGNHPQYGVWLILKALEESDASVAGPSRLKELEEGIQHLRIWGAERVHIDGALDRLSHLLLTDAGIVLSTGATVGRSLPEVRERTNQVLEWFSLPVAENFPQNQEAGGTGEQSRSRGTGLEGNKGRNAFRTKDEWHSLPGGLWLWDWCKVVPAKPEALYLSGAFTDQVYFALRERKRLPQRFYLDSPAQLLLTTTVWHGLKARGIEVYLRRKPKLVFLSLSPWHPLNPIPTEELAEALIPYSPVPLVDLVKQKIWYPHGSL